jgi:uncharacterized membrane protein SirB2
MKKIVPTVLLNIFLILISLGIYIIQIIQFNSLSNTTFYFLQDLAFLPLEVVIVTIVLGSILNAREKRERLKKTNIAISAFFSEEGTSILASLVKFNTECGAIHKKLSMIKDWNDGDFKKALELMKGYTFAIDSRISSLIDLKAMLLGKRNFLLRMLSNPNLLEHETFTDMLWAVFHLSDELNFRKTLDDLPESDMTHLSYDIKRALSTLLVQWINQMEHLKHSYPYLYSLEARRNPFSGVCM